MFPFLLGLIAAAPEAAQHPVATRAQQAEVKALIEKLGDCHRAHAKAAAATKASVDRIVAETMVACEPRVKPIRAVIARVAGAAEADRIIAQQQPRWKDAIRRNVAAARAAK